MIPENVYDWIVGVVNDSPAPICYRVHCIIGQRVHTIASCRVDAAFTAERLKAFVQTATEPVYTGRYQMSLEAVYADGARRLFPFVVSN